MTDNIERIQAPAGQLSPMHHGGDFSEDIADALDRVPLGEHASHIAPELPVITQSRPVRKVLASTYTLGGGQCLLVAPYQPLRKSLVFSNVSGSSIALSIKPLIVDALGNPLGNNYFALGTTGVLTLDYLGVMYASFLSAPGSNATLSVLDEIYA